MDRLKSSQLFLPTAHLASVRVEPAEIVGGLNLEVCQGFLTFGLYRGSQLSRRKRTAYSTVVKVELRSKVRATLGGPPHDLCPNVGLGCRFPEIGWEIAAPIFLAPFSKS